VGGITWQPNSQYETLALFSLVGFDFLIQHHTTTTIKQALTLDEKQRQKPNLLVQVMIHEFRAIWNKFLEFLGLSAVCAAHQT